MNPQLLHATRRDFLTTSASGLGFAQGATPATPNTIEARLGGTLRAGPDPDGGWTVDAVLPRSVATT